MTAVDRRGLIRSSFAIGVAAVSPAFIWGCVRNGESGAISDAQRTLLAILSDLVIPASETPSASAVGVPVFVELALKHGLDGTAADGKSSDGGSLLPGGDGGASLLAELEAQLDRAAGQAFTKSSAQQRHDALAKVDAAAFAASAPGVWRKIKDLILIGYYGSEVGASKELAYELVPGRFDPDVPITAATRSYSSDWTARDFG